MEIKKYDYKIKKRAKFLRKKGLSYKEISDKLGIVKSTARLWCKDIILKPEQIERLYTKQIKMMAEGPKSSHERRKKEIQTILENAEKEIKFPIECSAYRLIGAALYWAEGSKTKHFCITNSDPFLIKFATNWMYDILNAKPEDLKVHLNIYKQQNEIEIKKFWSQLTKIPLENFGKSFVKPENKNYKKNTLYYGTIKIRIKRGTNLRYRVFGWINAILKNLNLEINNTEKQWQKLKTDYMRL